MAAGLGIGVGVAAIAWLIAGLDEVVRWWTQGVTPPVTVGLLLVLYVCAYRTEFESASGSAVPTQPVLVALLLLVPLALVPAIVLVGQLLASAGGRESDQWSHRLAIRLTSGWHCFGPVLVLHWLDPGPVTLDAWPVYALALGSQFVVDAASSSVRAWSLGVPLRSLIEPMGFTWSVDATLAPLGLSAVIAADGSPVIIVLLLAPLGLVRVLARDRAAHLETALTLGSAFSQVKTEARVDAMTGLGNRRAWDEGLAIAQRRLDEDPHVPVTVVMADLDFLKRTNDTLGHDAGDRLIQRAARFLAAAVPPDAVVARLGGDEFGVLLVGGHAPHRGAELIDAIRTSIAAAPLAERVAISLGWSSCPPAATIGQAIISADLAVASDKASRRAGRDDVVERSAESRPTPVEIS